MKVQIYGASDDLIEIEGDIRKEIGVNTSTAKKFYVYCQNELQMTLQIKFSDAGYWQVIPQVDVKTWDEDNTNFVKNWDIILKMSDAERCRYSTTLVIDSHDDEIEITQKRKKA